MIENPTAIVVLFLAVGSWADVRGGSDSDTDANDRRGGTIRSPCRNKIDTLLDAGLAVARSGIPSPLQSARCTIARWHPDMDTYRSL
jgi:hypothetical protein